MAAAAATPTGPKDFLMQKKYISIVS